MHHKQYFTIFLSVFLVVLLPIFIKNNSKNTCGSYFDYLLINFSENCFYNPDVELDIVST